MTNVVKAGSAYFAMVFATAFLLGTLRVTLLVPRLGELGGLAIELPLLLIYSWIACGLIVRRLAVSGALSDRLAMGAIAFALLMAAEFAVSTFRLREERVRILQRHGDDRRRSRAGGTGGVRGDAGPEADDGRALISRIFRALRVNGWADYRPLFPEKRE